VVSTTVGGIPELVDERSGRLVPPDDPVALSEAIDDVLGNLERYNRDAIAAAARGRYGLDVVGEQLSRIYEAARRPSEDAAA
jgi:glycosyltransferase involved in cell wall biosynthesis